MSRLEAFRKQAKQLVRWHREGNHSIGGRIRGLPRYRELTDNEALKLKFPLSEAQEIIAREAGFPNWTALKAAVGSEVATAKAPRPKVVVKSAFPVVFVASVPDTAAFFRDKLGFTVDFLHGHPAFYCAVSRGGATIHLRLVDEPIVSQERREKEALLAAYIPVENAKGLFEEFKAKDVPLVGTLRKEPWGGPTFIVRDPDGNWICFCEG
jgi:catechol 2,3-dioxygenase-like lactoylglutathione lyase family enzyme